jgi:hypothetical protein
VSKKIAISCARASDNKTNDLDAVAAVKVIKDGKLLAKPVAEIRALLATGKTKQAEALKVKLPGVLWSGQFTQRGAAHLTTHSGLLCADLDDLGDVRTIRMQLQRSKHLWALFASPTGKGLKAVFRVRADVATHPASFEAVKAHIKELTGVEVDESCKDVARLCFLSHDPDAYSNEAAVELAPLTLPKAATNDAPGPLNHAQLTTRQKIAVELLRAVKWTSATTGFCTCPAIDLHTGKDGPKDCEVYLDADARVHCVHNSCKTAVVKANQTLNAHIRRAEKNAPPPTAAADKRKQILEKRDRRDVAAAKLDASGVFYDGSGYWITGSSGKFIPVNEKGIVRRLEAIGKTRLNAMGADGEDKDDWLTLVQDNFFVDYVGAVAGHPIGSYTFNRRRILVSSSAPITEATYGGGRLVWNYINLLLGPEQAMRLHAWIKVSREMLLADDFSKFMGMIIAGERDLGKTVLGLLIVAMFDGTTADPYSNMIGGTGFNKDLVEAILLWVDDRGDDPTMAGARHLTAAIKSYTASGTSRVEGKYANAGALNPFWRLLIMMNDSAKALQPLHGLTSEMLDKIMVLKAVTRAVCKPTRTLEERRTFLNPLLKNVPDYLGQLEKWTIPAELTDNRYMIKAWQHLDLLAGIRSVSDETILLGLIDMARVWSHKVMGEMAWTLEKTGGDREIELTDNENDGVLITANALHQFLIEREINAFGTRSLNSRTAEKKFPTVQSLSMHLAELNNTHPERIGRSTLRAPETTSRGRFWLIKPPVVGA